MHGHASSVLSLLEYGADANARTADVTCSSLAAVIILVLPAGCVPFYARHEHRLSDQCTKYPPD